MTTSAAPEAQSIFSHEKIEVAFSGQCFAVPSNEVFIPISGGQFDIAVYPAQVTLVKFPSWIKLKDAEFVHSGFVIEQTGNNLKVTPRPGLPKSTRANLLITTDKVKATMSMRIAESPDAVTGMLHVTPLPPEEYERRKAEAQARKREQTTDEELHDRRRVAAVLLAEELIEPHDPVPYNNDVQLTEMRGADMQRPREPDQVHVHMTRISWAKGHRYLRVIIDNPETRPWKLGEARVGEGKREAVPVEIVMDEGIPPEEGALAVIAPKSSAEAMVLLPDDIQSNIDDMTLQLYGPRGGLPILAAAPFWKVDFVPVPAEEVKRQDRARQYNLSLRAIAGLQAVGVGAVQMDDSSSFTTVRGLACAFSMVGRAALAWKPRLVPAEPGTHPLRM